MGFAAAILRRGVQFVQIPTSLLAQVDSSIGGKTGINSLSGKNMIGSFYQPSLVISDIEMSYYNSKKRPFFHGSGENLNYREGQPAFTYSSHLLGTSVICIHMQG